jgi:uncharacterized lipoprotein YmbA
MLRFFAIVLIASMLMGCAIWRGGDSSEQTTQPHYYVLEVDRGEREEIVINAPTLRIAPLRMTSKFRGQQIVFRTADSSYMPQVDHQFLTPPNEILQQQLENWLIASGLFSQVIADESSTTDWVLETAVTAFYGEARSNFSPAAILEMQFFFRSTTAPEDEGLVESGLHVSVNIAEMTPPAVVTGWRQALMKTLIALEVNLSDYFQK